MTEVYLAPDVDWTVIEELDDERKCENGATPCERKAEWLAIMPCCGRDLVICNPCKELADMVDRLVYGQEYLCSNCRAPFVLRPGWVRWERI